MVDTNPERMALLQRLYQSLRTVRFDPIAKPSRWENLTDILEVLAVAAGLKPAHLNGRGSYSAATLEDLERIALQYGLKSQRTLQHLEYHHRVPRMDAGLYQHHLQQQRIRQQQLPPVLWIYQQDLLRDGILRLVQNHANPEPILGYPACCITADSEILVQMLETKERMYRRRYGAITPEDLIRCHDLGVETPMEIPLARMIAHSTRRFPFVQFTACERCQADVTSPAAHIHDRMEDLAEHISTELAEAIRAAAVQETVELLGSASCATERHAT